MMAYTPRNKIQATTLPVQHWQDADTLFEICDAEFNGRKDIYNSFVQAKGSKSWARYTLLHEVRKIADREGIYCSYHMALVVAVKLSEIWFEQKDTA